MSLPRPRRQSALVGRVVGLCCTCVSVGCTETAVFDLFPPEPSLQVPDAGSGSTSAMPSVPTSSTSTPMPTSIPTSTPTAMPPTMPGTAGAPATVDAGSMGGAPTSSSSLVHRYSFSDAGTIATDSVGAAHGELRDGATLVSGSVVFDGVDGYVSLPSGLVSKLHSATFMLWATWRGDTSWQRFWDFGNFFDSPESSRQEADRTFFLTPSVSYGAGQGPAAFLEFRGPLDGTDFGHEYLIVDTQSPIAAGTQYQYTVILDEEVTTMSLYIDARFIAERSLRVGASDVYYFLGDITDTNNVLGASQYEVDPPLEGDINEFRIYERALTAPEIMTAFDAGPDVDTGL